MSPQQIPQPKIGDLVTAKNNNFGIVIGLIVDPLYTEDQLHIKVHIFKHNKSSWFLPGSINVINELK